MNDPDKLIQLVQLDKPKNGCWAVETRDDNNSFPVKVYLTMDVNGEADRFIYVNGKNTTFGPVDSKNYLFYEIVQDEERSGKSTLEQINNTYSK